MYKKHKTEMYSKKASYWVNDWLHELSPKIQYCRLKIGISNTSNLSLDYTRICSKTWQNLSIYNVLFFFSFSPSSSFFLPSFTFYILCWQRHTYHSQHGDARDNLWKSVLSFQHVGSRDWTHVIRFSIKSFYELSHLDGSMTYTQISNNMSTCL